LLVFVLGAFGVQTVGAAPGWWDSQWKIRRRIELKGARRTAHAPLVAYCQFRDFGNMKEDASDVRVVNEQGKPVPFRVKFYHPRLYCVVAFEPDDTHWRGYVYYGNPNAPNLDNKWDARSGLFLTTYRRTEGGFDNWQQMQETVRRSFAEPDGGGFRGSIFDGYNPFGSSLNFVSYYDGYFYAGRAGTYRFATISDDASFVFVDGKMIAQWPGSHGAVGGLRGEHSGVADLQAGAHHVQYYHQQVSATTVAELAWTRPGEKQPRVMMPEDYLPVFDAVAGLQESQNDPITLEFSAVPVSTLEYGGYHYILWRFGDLCGAPGSPSVASQWDFGNGLTSNARTAMACFFHEGDYPVTLRTTLGNGQTRTVKQWIRVSDLVQLDVGEKPGSFDRAAQMVGDYPIGGLSEADRRAILTLLVYRERSDAIEKMCRAWLDEVYRKNAPVPVDFVLELGRVLTDVRKKYPDAEAMYDEATRHLRPDDPFDYQVYLALGELRLRYLKKYDAAIAALDVARQKVKARNEIYRRRIAIATGDAYRAKLARDQARRQYQEAEQLVQPSRADAQMRSSYGLTAEAFLGRGDNAEALEKLQEWAYRFPTDKLNGYWSLLMSRCLNQMKRYGEAADELALAAKLEPFGTYTRDVLAELGQSHLALGRYKEAIEALRAASTLFDDPTKRKTLEEQIARIQQTAGPAR
jgi:tetratricopeptide (TPR) repeat protein